ncbi:helix-turn-helix transcriptional regulator [Solihabitans fulvus]|uniref:Helix-turn-helix transcriptional regulator n=1 Tax=Solihabitans fulvus TaxID=1892852 RepID=A0A5B2WII1_9PSEU|nr:helix-turn-helix transcriptional regulator [Solihabitans fulvus]KAA2251205.1 helix-turn-helix transcriptional regulator [Solihabitans fulvus]
MSERREWFGSPRLVTEAKAEHPHDTEDLVRLVRVTRQERDWTQTRLAEAVGVPEAELVRFEAGETVPAEPLAMRLIEAMRA